MTVETDRAAVVVVGGSAAGLAAVRSLRAEGHVGQITVVSDEGLPYDRPPLSKEILSGERLPRDVMLAGVDELAGLDVMWLSGARAVSTNLRDRVVGLDGGEQLHYDRLVIATGLRARRPASLVPEPTDGVHVLRTLADAIGLKEAAIQVDHVTVVGAGFIGAELASTMRFLGKSVTVIDPLLHPLGGIAAGPLAAWLGRTHRAHGVDLRCGVGVASLVTTQGAVSGVVLSGGATLETELVVLALGGQPAVEWLAGNGLDLTNGVACGEDLLVTPGVYVVGDVARPVASHGAGGGRVEHRLNATQQGLHVGRAIATGADDPYRARPYFWSDQFGSRIQGYGRPLVGDRIEVLERDPGEGRFVQAHLRDGEVVAVVGIGMPRQVRTAAAELIGQRRDLPASDQVGRAQLLPW